MNLALKSAVLKTIRDGELVSAYPVTKLNQNSKKEALAKLTKDMKNDNYLVILIKQ
jgi:hypothetical protein